MNDNWWKRNYIWIVVTVLVGTVIFSTFQIQQERSENRKITCPYGEITKADIGYNCCIKCGEATYNYLNFVKENSGLFKTGFEHCTCLNPSTKEVVQLW